MPADPPPGAPAPDDAGAPDGPPHRPPPAPGRAPDEAPRAGRRGTAVAAAGAPDGGASPRARRRPGPPPPRPAAPLPVLEDLPAVVAGHDRAGLLTADGELLLLPVAEAAALLRAPGTPPPLLVHAPQTLRRLGLGRLPCLDLLELWAFALPARPVPPTPRGLALALDLPPPVGPEAAAALLPAVAAALLRRLHAARDLPINRDAAALALRLAEGPAGARGGREGGWHGGWPWGPLVAAALGQPEAAASAEGLRVWRRLPEWEERPPPPPPASLPVGAAEARTRLAALLGPGTQQRQGQSDYAAAAASAFAPRERAGDPALVLAEAGTGTGKTLGYVAPASLWAERNGGPVWLSTFTRHLQRQLDAELTRLHPDPAERRRRVVVRKGRENYLCLLNMEDAANNAVSGVAPASLLPLALLSRWALATTDGDLQGGDLPGWFGELFGQGNAGGLADRRGECIHGACPHYRRCFVEHTIRRARTAELVVANHALVMAQAAWGGLDDGSVPTRYVFDEGHHVFDAADGAFSAELSGIEAAELRRWLLGAEGGRSRARGLRRRLDDLAAGRPELQAPMDALLAAARALPAPGWSLRLSDDALPDLLAADAAPAPPAAGDRPGAADGDAVPDTTDATTPGTPPGTPLGTPPTAAPGDAPDDPGGVLPRPAAVPSLPPGLSGPGGGPAVEPDAANPSEQFLAALRRQVLARMPGEGGDGAAFGRPECTLHPVSPALREAAARLERALARIAEPLHTLSARLEARLEQEADELDSATRGRIEAMVRTLRRRAEGRLSAWISTLRDCASPAPEPGERPQHVHVLQLDRLPAGLPGAGGAHGRHPARDADASIRRHWLDPTIPFAATLAAPAHGVLVTSATLRDSGTADAELAWAAAEDRVGASHLPSPALRVTVASPFDYARQSRAFVVNDLPHGDPGALAGAFRALFLASGGGGLGLFTAISRLRAVHARIAAPLEAAGIPLLAQHVDAMDNATLVDVFRTEEESCLLGTDAMRDGVDVPGRALRLVVFERVPWPRPDILHRERRTHLSGGDPAGYDDRIARLRLRQAFGRLIRSEGDRGAFVLLDRRCPTRLLSALPAGVTPRRVGLAEAVREVAAFLGPDAPGV